MRLNQDNSITTLVLAALLLASAIPCPAQTASPEKLFKEGVEAQQRGEDAVAVRAYRALLRSHPEAVAVRVNLGATLAHMGKFTEAIEEYKIVLAHDPKNQMARMNLAEAYHGSGDIASTIKELLRLHQENLKDDQISMMLADCYVQSGRGAEAIPLLEPLGQAHAGDPNVEWLLGSALIQGGRTEEGAARVEKLAAKTANAEAWLLAGQTRLGLTQFDVAQHDADAAQGLNPKLAGLLTLRGMIQEQTGDYDGAEASLLLAAATDPNDYNAQYYLGAIYYFKRDMEKAKIHLTKALEVQPNSSQAHFEMALVARTEGRTDAALQELEFVVRQSPDWLQPHIELSALYYRLHRAEDGAKQKEIVDKMLATQQQQSQPLAAH